MECNITTQWISSHNIWWTVGRTQLGTRRCRHGTCLKAQHVLDHVNTWRVSGQYQRGERQIWECQASAQQWQHCDMCHVCTCMRPNWVLPTVCQILRDEIHCAVMSHSMSYRCPPRSNCKFHFNSMCPNMLAYLLSPISQNHLSISACCSPCLCSI